MSRPTAIFRKLEGVKGYLIDLDGVVYSSGKPIAGAVETVHWLRSAEIPHKFVTNTSVMSRQSLVNKMNAMGFEVDQSDLITAASAAAKYLREQGDVSAYLLAYEDVRKDFTGINLETTDPDYVVIGSRDDGYGYEHLRRAFRYLYQGAKFIAIHKNRTWMRPDGLTMGVGAYVSMLQYAANVETIIIGKPSREFFELALKDLNLSPTEVAMIGDDLESDVLGAQRMGMKGIFAASGKYKRSDCAKLDIKPDVIIDDISDIRKAGSHH
jgi:HAD superfamily hydrolase (TIGR01458 family)